MSFSGDDTESVMSKGSAQTDLDLHLLNTTFMEESDKQDNIVEAVVHETVSSNNIVPSNATDIHQLISTPKNYRHKLWCPKR